jgi:hypothetical protein
VRAQFKHLGSILEEIGLLRVGAVTGIFMLEAADGHDLLKRVIVCYCSM